MKNGTVAEHYQGKKLQTRKRGWLWALLSLFLFSVSVSFVMTSSTHAACSHTSLGEQFYENNHPHAYYRYCRSCGTKVYTGEFYTKPHGSGTNGTCSKCGRHRFSERNCTQAATCYCGATLPAYGHNYGEQYSEATHPHRYYKRCSRCNGVTYTGGNATKLHGDGSWGSGTCPHCGSHRYIGQSCTKEGLCICGSKLPALGHTYGPQYCTAEHPHRYYKRCNRCKYMWYTGGPATKKHGPGKWGSGSCPKCGQHSYTFEEYNIMTHPHPHPAYKNCICGDRAFCGYIEYDACASCRAGRKTIEAQEFKTATFVFPDGDEICPIIRVITLSLKIDYFERYKISGSEFISYESVNKCNAVNSENFPDVTICVAASSDVICYDSSGNYLFTRKLHPDSYMIDTKATASGGYFSQEGIPAYSEIGCAAYIKGSMYTCTKKIIVYYD